MQTYLADARIACMDMGCSHLFWHKPYQGRRFTWAKVQVSITVIPHGACIRASECRQRWDMICNGKNVDKHVFASCWSKCMASDMSASVICGGYWDGGEDMGMEDMGAKDMGKGDMGWGIWGRGVWGWRIGGWRIWVWGIWDGGYGHGEYEGGDFRDPSGRHILHWGPSLADAPWVRGGWIPTYM